MGNKILFKFIRENKFSYLIGTIFMLLSSYIQTLFPKILGQTIDILKTSNFSPHDVYVYISYIILVALGTFCTTYAWRNLINGGARKLECYLREKLFEHFQILPQEFYNRRKTGDLIAYAINDINAVRMTFGHATAMSVNGLVVCIISVYSMTQAINWRLTLCSLLPIPLMVYIMFFVGKVVRKRFRRVQETFAAVSDRVNENINGIRVIKAYVQEDSEVEKFQTLNRQMVKTNLSMVRASAFLSPTIELCFTVSFVLNLVWGGNMVLNGSVSLGNFVAFNGYLTMILAPVLSIGRVITIIQRGMASLGRLNDILSVKSNLSDGIVDTFQKHPSIHICNLSFTYPESEKEALSSINLDIPSGHTIGIIGKTGSGKTTLANLLLKIHPISDRTIVIGGTDINDFQLATLRNSFGFVPQDTFLFRAQIDENIRFFKDIYTDEEVQKASENSCIYEHILELPDGFKSVLGERGVNISGGQKQRISIARALVKDPEILILDDALSAVDTVTEAKILANLRRERKNKTTIIIASRISAVMEADEIIVLDEGKICERGTHKQLFEKGGLYREICDYQRNENQDGNCGSS